MTYIAKTLVIMGIHIYRCIILFDNCHWAALFA